MDSLWMSVLRCGCRSVHVLVWVSRGTLYCVLLFYWSRKKKRFKIWKLFISIVNVPPTWWCIFWSVKMKKLASFFKWLEKGLMMCTMTFWFTKKREISTIMANIENSRRSCSLPSYREFLNQTCNCKFDWMWKFFITRRKFDNPNNLQHLCPAG